MVMPMTRTAIPATIMRMATITIMIMAIITTTTITAITTITVTAMITTIMTRVAGTSITTVIPMLMTTSTNEPPPVADRGAMTEAEAAALYRLMTWLSPAFPVGGF